MFDEVSYYDLKTKISLKTEEKVAETMQNFESLCIVVSKTLGNSQENKTADAPKTADELEAKLARYFK